MGTTGPKDIDPATGKPWALSFPVITVRDMVRAQKRLIDHLGIASLFCVIGGSMGGMQVLEWAASYPESVFAAVPVASAARHSAQNIAFHEVGRQAIMADPDWCEGQYLEAARRPARGLAVARMAAHITYLSEAALHRKFGRNLQDRNAVTWGFDADFQVESYLRHQGSTFVDRFDANSYLYITRAMDYFDLAAEHDVQYVDAVILGAIALTVAHDVGSFVVGARFAQSTRPCQRSALAAYQAIVRRIPSSHVIFGCQPVSSCSFSNPTRSAITSLAPGR